MFKLVLIFLAILVLFTIVMVLVGNHQWDKKISLTIEKLIATESESQTFEPKCLTGLPVTVQTYLQNSIPPGSKLIKSARIGQVGGFKAKLELDNWAKMTATQHFSGLIPGFVWDARITMIPGLKIRVFDSYINGHGGMLGKIAALFTVVDEKSQPALNQAALQRYLAEAVWFPTALLPGDHLSWEAIDAKTARATLTDSGISISLEFSFNELGEIVSVYSPNRYREVNGEYVPTPWKGYFSDYIEMDGYHIPSYGIVAWILDGKEYPYWRGKLDNIEYL